MNPPISGIHHLKFLVADLDQSGRFYEEVFGAKRVEALDHRKPDGRLFATILSFPGLGTMLELRLDAAGAAAQCGFDPVTLLVETVNDLHLWCRHLETIGAPHSPVLNGFVGWLVVIEDPDGRRIRLYTREQHGPEIKPSHDQRWLGP